MPVQSKHFHSKPVLFISTALLALAYRCSSTPLRCHCPLFPSLACLLSAFPIRCVSSQFGANPKQFLFRSFCCFTRAILFLAIPLPLVTLQYRRKSKQFPRESNRITYNRSTSIAMPLYAFLCLALTMPCHSKPFFASPCQCLLCLRHTCAGHFKAIPKRRRDLPFNSAAKQPFRHNALPLQQKRKAS